jgi:hypothetical protein
MWAICRRGVKLGHEIADDIVVTDQADVRCPSCSALVRAGSPWCTLCYADLRPQPVAVQPADLAHGTTLEAVREPEPSYAGAGASFDPLTAPLSMIEGAASAVQQAPSFTVAPDVAPDVAAGAALLPAPVAAAVDAQAKAPAGWPCSRCATLVSFEDLACTTCGTPFLAGAAGEADLIERIGRGGLSKTAKALIVGGGSLAIIIVIVSLMYLASLIL